MAQVETSKQHFPSFTRLLTIMGLMVISLNKSTDHFMYSFLKLAYAFILATLLSCGCYFQVTFFMETSPDDSILYGLLHLYPMVSQTLMALLIILSSINGNRIFISHVNRSDNALTIKHLCDFFNSNLFFQQFVISAIIFFFPYLLDLLFYRPIITASPVTVSYIFIVYNYISLNMFSLTLLTIRLMYRSINCKIETLTISPGIIQTDSLKTWKNVIKTRLTLDSIGQIKQAPPKTNIECLDGRSELFRLRGEHHQLYLLCRKVNSIYSLINLLLIVHHGVLGVIFSHWGLRQYFSKHTVNDWAELVSVFRAAILSFGSIIWLIVPVVKLSKEVDRTGEILQTFLIVTKDKASQSEIKTFYLQLLIENVIFSPYGFFQLNNELLLAMCAAVVSYMVILLQYQLMMDEVANASV